MPCSAASAGRGRCGQAAAQRVHVYSEWRERHDVAVHQSRQGLRPFALVEAAGEASRELHGLQRAASSEWPGPGARLRGHVADGGEDRRSERAAVREHGFVRSTHGGSDWRSRRVSRHWSSRSVRERVIRSAPTRSPFRATAFRSRRKTIRRQSFNRLFGEEAGRHGGAACEVEQAAQRARRGAWEDATSLRTTLGNDDRTNSTSICIPCATWNNGPSGSMPGSMYRSRCWTRSRRAILARRFEAGPANIAARCSI